MRGFRMVLPVLAALLAAAGGAGAANAPRMQRMLIGTGCYRIAGHASGPVPAYCLDQDGAAPGRGAILGDTPALGRAIVTVGGETLPLSAALDRHMLRVEGTDTPDQLTLVNTTDQPLSLCVDHPVVVMGNGIDYSRDLERIYDRIEALVRSDRASDKADRHEELQRRLWSMVNGAADQDWAERTRLGGPSAPPDSTDCVAGGTDAVLCR